MSTEPAVVPMLAPDYVLAPAGQDAESELQQLRGLREPAAKLRAAFLQLERNQPRSAMDLCAEVLYGPEKPSATAEALARCLRAEAYDKLGEPERSRYERERALEVAFDERVRARLLAGNTMAKAPAPAASLTVRGRAEWDPAAPIRARLEPMGRIYRVTVHHSALPFRDTSVASCAAQLRVIQKNHMQHPDRRYGDIGYHYLIDPAGRIWEGRKLQWQGAHARAENNRGNIGICLLGNFVRGTEGQRPTEPQVQALTQLVAELTARHHIPADQLFSHSDLVVTECPGPYLEPVVEHLAKQLRAVGPARLGVAAAQ